MTSTRRHMVRTRRAAAIGLLVAVLVPLTGCGGDDSGDAPGQVENNETEGSDGEDDGGY
jgi:hypothetical protein